MSVVDAVFVSTLHKVNTKIEALRSEQRNLANKNIEIAAKLSSACDERDTVERLRDAVHKLLITEPPKEE